MEQKVDVLVHIRKNATGEVRVIKEFLYIWEWNEGVPQTFIWEEGNYSCDCNRRLFFNRVNNDDEGEDVYCSDGEYSVNIMFGEGCIYSEFEKETKTKSES